MQEQAPALWLVITTGAVSGLLASIVGYVLLGLPLVKVKVRHDLRVDATGARVDSCVVVANVRGRPVKIDHVWIVKRHPGRGPGMSRPKGWTFPHMLVPLPRFGGRPALVPDLYGKGRIPCRHSFWDLFAGLQPQGRAR